MSAPNGHAQEMDATKTILRPPDTVIGVAAPPYSAELIKELVAAMEVLFDSSQIEWPVIEYHKEPAASTRPGSPVRRPESLHRSLETRCLPRQAGRASTPFIPAPISSEAGTRKLSRKCSSRVS